jgi:ubiquinone/menaquinone biosynthesis C-methylase UbiE
VSHAPKHLLSVLDLLACPTCRGALRAGPYGLNCAACGQVFPLHDGIPLLGTVGAGETWGRTVSGETSVPYQKLFLSENGAQRYRDRYMRCFAKRFTTRRELRLLRRLLASQGRCRVLLDLPSGNGRVSEPLAGQADLVIEADIGLGQVELGRQLSRVTTPQIWMTASAFNIPLRDGSVDGAVCNRLLHHLPTTEERERVIAELLRVASRFVLLTFFDYYSVKNLLRLARWWSHGARHKNALRVSTLAEWGRRHGARLAASPRLFLFGSGQRYALLVKNSP